MRYEAAFAQILLNVSLDVFFFIYPTLANSHRRLLTLAQISNIELGSFLSQRMMAATRENSGEDGHRPLVYLRRVKELTYQALAVETEPKWPRTDNDDQTRGLRVQTFMSWSFELNALVIQLELGLVVKPRKRRKSFEEGAT